MKPLDPSARILVYTDGEVIGDGILRLSFAAALKRAMPHVHTTWLASGYSVYENALHAMAAPLIDQLIILPDRRMLWRDFLRGPKPLQGQRFDLIIDTQRNAKRTMWLKRIPHTRFMSAAAGYLLATARPASTERLHFLDTLLQLGELGTGHMLTAPPLSLPTGDWAEQACALLPERPRYIGFVIGAGHPDKCWPLERFITLARHVTTQGAVPVFFLGPKEQAQEAAIRFALPGAILPLNSAPTGEAPSPYLTIALAARLSAAVANDSGGGHLLAAGGVPLVSLFRSATVRKKFLPRTARVVALAPEDFGSAAMPDIPLEAVQAALDTLRT